MAHAILIAAHAVAGVVCFIAGALALRVSSPRSWQFRVFAGSLAAMLLFLAAAIGVDWGSLDATARLIYPGLFALGLYMGWRAVHATARLRQHDTGWQARYLDDVGFSLVALFEGFLIVAAIDLDVPTWATVLVAFIGLVVGNRSIRHIKTRARRGVPIPG